MLQGLSRSTWERGQQFLGYSYSQARNGFQHGIDVAYFHGATVINKANSSHHRGMTMGNMINGWKIYAEKSSMLYHEYGHTIQSRIFGPLYLPVVGIPSAIAGSNHDYGAWSERRANWYSYKYFGAETWFATAGNVLDGDQIRYPIY